jgi:glycosyltransferase involved in cell wall biosynthesis
VLEEEARRSGAGERIRFLGLRSDVPRILPCLDIYTLPSISEGLSISILEAMAASLPVVATRVGGNSEAVKDGSTGLLVPSRSREALAASLQSLVVDSERRRRMGDAGRRRVLERFTVDRMISGYEGVYAAAHSA